MGLPVARLGDTSDHGGKIISASSTFTVGGIPVARVTDMFDCPNHGQNPIVSSSTTQTDGGLLLAHIGSKTACGATITTGDANFTLG
mgnify:CR=1 FL=1